MSPTFVLRIPRSDIDDDSVVLAHVTPSTSKKAKPLDVKLVATEGENPYTVTLQHSKIQGLKSDSCTPDEWEQILLAILLEQGLVEDIELTAKVRTSKKEGAKLEITVRKRIQNITQRFGTINLEQNDDEEDSDVTLWCGIAVEAREKDRADLAAANAKVEELEQQAKSLRDLMDEFIEAKREHEDEMLQKTEKLLNSKKLKIRQYQTAFRALGIDPETLDQNGGLIQQQATKKTQATKKAQPSSSRKPAASRSSKRKADEPEPDADGGAEVDAVKQEYEQDSDRDVSEDEKTTDDDATASEPDSDDGGAGNAASNSKLITPASTEETTTRKTSKGKERETTPSAEALPAKRILPFAGQSRPNNKTQPATKPKEPSPPLEGSETESDDEL